MQLKFRVGNYLCKGFVFVREKPPPLLRKYHMALFPEYNIIIGPKNELYLWSNRPLHTMNSYIYDCAIGPHTVNNSLDPPKHRTCWHYLWLGCSIWCKLDLSWSWSTSLWFLHLLYSFSKECYMDMVKLRFWIFASKLYLAMFPHAKYFHRWQMAGREYNWNKSCDTG